MQSLKLIDEWTNVNILILGSLVRLLLIFYAVIHDNLFDVRFTDIDYSVYTDGAAHIFNGSSPFDRTTYRYTPLLAWILVPTVKWLNFGKYLFSAVDILIALLISRFVRNELDRTNTSEESKRKNVLIALAVWLFNPLTAIVSARGNADTLVCGAVICSLYLLSERKWILSSIVLGGVAIQLKIYPLIYLPSIYLNLLDYNGRDDSIFSCSSIARLVKNWRGIIYILITVATFIVPCIGWYQLYGHLYLREAIFYHLYRVDIKHNFSPYFYLLYLLNDHPSALRLAGSLAFIPQALLVLILSFRFAHDLPICWLFVTIVFVSFNKVCTSQYFVWYICLLPLCIYKILPKQGECNRHFWTTNAAYWFGGQGCWLLFAYLLEFRGLNTFLLIWLCSLVFLIINIFLLRRFMTAYYQYEFITVKHCKTE